MPFDGIEVRPGLKPPQCPQNPWRFNSPPTRSATPALDRLVNEAASSVSPTSSNIGLD